MAYIRIKVKHLLIVIGAVGAVLAAVFYLQGGILYGMGRLSELGGDGRLAGVYYDRAVNNYPSSRTAIAAAKRKLELMFDEKDFGYFRKMKLSGGSMFLDGSYISGDSADWVNRQYESIAKYAARDDAFAGYSMYVALVNYFAGYGENAVKLLKSLDYVKDTELKGIGALHLAAVQMGLGNMEEGYEVLKESLRVKDSYSLIRQELYGYYCFMKGDFEEFKKTSIDTGEWYKSTKAVDSLLLKPLLQINNTLSGHKEIVETAERLKQNGNVFSGRASIDGKPAAYAIVYLKDTNFRNRETSSTGIQLGTKCAAVTGSDGSFRIENVPDGIYGIGVSIDWQRIQGRALQMDKSFSLQFSGNTAIEENISFFKTDGMVIVEDAGEGKFRFKVNLPPEAAYYTINMGELTEIEDSRMIANNRFYSERIAAAEYILDTVKERDRGMNTGASFGNGGIDPRYLFEPFYHTGDYAYYVTFYDSTGDILYDSSGIYPNRQKDTVRISGSQWSEADKLLLDQKYDEAIKLYEKELDESKASGGQQGLHALKVLTKLYYNGWEYDAETSTLKNKNTEKATEYFEWLTDRIKDNEQINSSLAGLYIDSGKFREGLELLQRNKSSYGLRQIAQVYGYMGKFSTAAEYYRSFNEATGHGADCLLMLYILQDKRELLPETAASYIDNGSFYANYEKLIEAYLKMDTGEYSEFYRLVAGDRPDEGSFLIAGRQDELALFYKALLLLQKPITDYKEREKQYRSFYDSVKEPTLRQLLQYFGKMGIQSDFGD